jgi:hypothetical protein
MTDELKEGMLFRRTSKVAGLKPKENEHITGQVEKCDKHDQSLIVSLSPLTNSMRICGLYFDWPFGDSSSASDVKGNHIAAVDTGASSAGKSTTGMSAKFAVFYATFVLVLVWINSIRLLTIFTSDDNTMQTILAKLMLLTWNVQCAVQQTAYFFACRTGKLDKVLNEIGLQSAICTSFVRRLAFKFAAVTWLFVAINLSFYVYAVNFSGGLIDLMLAPFGIYVHASSMTAVRALYVVVSIHLHTAWLFPVSMTFMLSIIFAFQFRYVCNRLRRTIDEANGSGIPDAVIEDIRQQHQTLCHVVERADEFLKIYHLVAFFGPLIATIIILFIIAFHRSMLSSSHILIFIYLFWLCAGFLQLSLTSAGGLVVNHYVRIVANSFLFYFNLFF